MAESSRDQSPMKGIIPRLNLTYKTNEGSKIDLLIHVPLFLQIQIKGGGLPLSLKKKNKSGPIRESTTSAKFGKKHEGTFLDGRGICYGCGKSGH